MSTRTTSQTAAGASTDDPPIPSSTGKSRSGRGRSGGAAGGFIAPGVLLVAVMLYLPLLWTLFISFTEYDGLGDPEFVGLENYVTMFSDHGFLNSMLNTLYWVVGTLTVPVSLGLLIALLTFGLRGGAWLRIPFLLPYALSGVAVGVIWSFILQPGGALSQGLALLGLPGSESRWLVDAPLNTVMMIVATAWQATGVNALLFIVGLQSIPNEPLEAARLDGASGWSLFRYFLWPMLRPLTTVVVGLSLVASLKTFDVVQSMTKGGPGRASETLALTMYKDTFANADYGLGSAVAVTLTIITTLASVLYLRRQLSAAQ